MLRWPWLSSLTSVFRRCFNGRSSQSSQLNICFVLQTVTSNMHAEHRSCRGGCLGSGNMDEAPSSVWQPAASPPDVVWKGQGFLGFCRCRFDFGFGFGSGSGSGSWSWRCCCCGRRRRRGRCRCRCGCGCGCCRCRCGCCCCCRRRRFPDCIPASGVAFLRQWLQFNEVSVGLPGGRNNFVLALTRPHPAEHHPYVSVESDVVSSKAWRLPSFPVSVRILVLLHWVQHPDQPDLCYIFRAFARGQLKIRGSGSAGSWKGTQRKQTERFGKMMQSHGSFPSTLRLE